MLDYKKQVFMNITQLNDSFTFIYLQIGVNAKYIIHFYFLGLNYKTFRMSKIDVGYRTWIS